MEDLLVRCMLLLRLLNHLNKDYKVSVLLISNSSLKKTATMGLEPTIFCSVGRRVIHYATRLIILACNYITLLSNCFYFTFSLEQISIPNNEHSDERLTIQQLDVSCSPNPVIHCPKRISNSSSTTYLFYIWKSTSTLNSILVFSLFKRFQDIYM